MAEARPDASPPGHTHNPVVRYFRLFMSAVLNGLLAPPLLTSSCWSGNNPKIMGATRTDPG